MTYKEDRTTGSPLEDGRHVNSRRDQLRDLAAEPNPDVSEPAKADLFKEFGGQADVE